MAKYFGSLVDLVADRQSGNILFYLDFLLYKYSARQCFLHKYRLCKTSPRFLQCKFVLNSALRTHDWKLKSKKTYPPNHAGTLTFAFNQN